MNDAEDAPLDDLLRDKFQAHSLPPSDRLWAGIEARLPAPEPPPDRPGPGRPFVGAWPVLLAGLIGLLAGWGGHAGLTTPETAPLRVATTRPPAVVAPLNARPQAAAPDRSLAFTAPRAVKAASAWPVRTREVSSAAGSVETSPVSTPAAAANSVTASTQPEPKPVEPTLLAAVVPLVLTPAPAGPVVPGTLVPFIQPEVIVLTISSADTARAPRAQLVAALQTEQRLLATLQHRNDSLLRTLSELPAVAVTDSLQLSHPPTLNPSRRWSVALAFAPERNFLTLNAPAADTTLDLRRQHETGRAGFSAALSTELALTPRLSLGLGVGYATTGAELRLTNRRTDVSVRYQNQTATTTTNSFSSTTVYSVRLDSLVQLSPRYNASGQVAYFDTIWIRRPDTVFTTVNQNGTVVTTTTTVTPVLTPHETVSRQTLRPEYRFLTVPVLVRYRLGASVANTPGAGRPDSRWWTDVALGAQFQFFLGGSQFVSADAGRSWQTEQVRASAAPFRRLNVALTGALALNYALTPRLSASVAPTVRWQARSLYKPETGLRQRAATTGIQLGLRWAL